MILDHRRFWSRVDISSDPDSCWPFADGARAKGGYGVVRVNGRTTTANRAAYELAVGEIPSGMMVCHTCDNPPCCNPAHLWLGTCRDNIADMRRKGRGFTKLTNEQVLVIRRDERKGAALARQYGVSEATISRVRRGLSWTHLDAAA